MSQPDTIEQIEESWDLFISYASEDKASFVAPLAKALSSLGVYVWYDEYELKLGDSLTESINAGLARSNYGLVVLSPAFIAKRWTGYELRGLTSREMIGGKIILPIWHNVSIEDVVKFNPPLADKVAIATNSMGIAEIAIKVIETIRPDILTNVLRRLAYLQLRESATRETIPIDKIVRSPIRHNQLSDELVSRIRLIRAALIGPYPHSMEFWLDGFKRDAHPTEQVTIWEHYASVYTEYAHMAELTQEQREACFRFIMSLADDLDDEKDVALQSSLPDGAIEILKNLFIHQLPVYDFEETLPEDEVAQNPDMYETPGFNDLEVFPKDLPKDLLADLHDKSKKNKDGELVDKVKLFPHLEQDLN
jgi:TIR domain